MDSEHRHELKQNELVEWLSHSGEFVRKNGITVVCVILIVVGLVLSLPFKSMRQKSNLKRQAEVAGVVLGLGREKIQTIQSQMQGMYVQNQLLVSANSLAIKGNEEKSPLLASLALIKRGEALRSDLHYSAAAVEAEIVASQIAEAKKAYENAINKAQGHEGSSSLIAMANFGLGLCAEELGDFNGAATIYSSIVENSDFDGTVFLAQAKFRLDTMERSKGKYVFKDAPVEIEMPVSESIELDIPAVELKPTESEAK